MTINRLTEINGRYLQAHRFSHLDYDIIQNTLDRLAFHHLPDDFPKTGDLVEGAYYDGLCPYRQGRIESVKDGVVTICCKPYTPFVSFDSKGKAVLSMSGGPFVHHRIEELQPIGSDNAQYNVWGCAGATADGAICIETNVRKWKIPYEFIPSSFVTEIDHVNPYLNPRLDAKVILHKDHMQFFARYSNMNQLQDLADLMGFKFTPDEEASKTGYRRYRLSHQLIEGKGFWKHEDLPAGAKPFVTHENGSLCTCYFIRNDEEKKIFIFKPNPNSKEVYDAFDVERSIRYHKAHGEAGPCI